MRFWVVLAIKSERANDKNEIKKKMNPGANDKMDEISSCVGHKERQKCKKKSEWHTFWKQKICNQEKKCQKLWANDKESKMYIKNGRKSNRLT